MHQRGVAMHLSLRSQSKIHPQQRKVHLGSTSNWSIGGEIFPHLGMGDCQLRSGEGQTRHRYLVMLTHSLLMARMRQGRARDWAHSVLTTIGEACRAVSRETLSKTISWVVDQATIGWTQERIVAHLKLV